MEYKKLSFEEIKSVSEKIVSNSSKVSIDCFCVRDLYTNYYSWYGINVHSRRLIGLKVKDLIDQNVYDIDWRLHNQLGAALYKNRMIEASGFNRKFEIVNYTIVEKGLKLELQTTIELDFLGSNDVKIESDESGYTDSSRPEVLFVIVEVKEFEGCDVEFLSNYNFIYFHDSYNFEEGTVCSMSEYMFSKNFVSKSLISGYHKRFGERVSKVKIKNGTPLLFRGTPTLKVCNVGAANYCYIDFQDSHVFVDMGYPTKLNQGKVNVTDIKKHMLSTCVSGDIAYLTHWHYDHYAGYDDQKIMGRLSSFNAPFSNVHRNYGTTINRIGTLTVNVKVDSFLRRHHKYNNINFIYPDLTKTKGKSQIYKTTITKLRKNRIEVTNTSLYRADASKRSYNNYGLLIAFYSKNKSVLFTGDMFKSLIDSKYGNSHTFDYLVYPHHGGFSGNLPFSTNYKYKILSNGKTDKSCTSSGVLCEQTYDASMVGSEPYNIIAKTL